MIQLELDGRPYAVHRCLALAILLQTTEDLGINPQGNSCPTQRAIREKAHREAVLFAFSTGGEWKEARVTVCEVAQVALGKFEKECAERITPTKIKEQMKYG